MNMDDVEMCLIAVNDNDTELFKQLLLDIKKRITKVPKATDAGINWVQDIPVFCTLYNNPSFIKKIHKQLNGSLLFPPSGSLADEITVLDLADALGFRSCKEQLMKLYGIRKGDKKGKLHVSDFAIFAAILNVGQIHDILDQNVVIQCFQRLVENGLDIHARGPENRTILHEAVVKKCTSEIFRLLFSLGCDVNGTDKFGHSAFMQFVWRAYDYKCAFSDESVEIVRILVMFLYENIDTSLDTCVVLQAHIYDRRKFPDEEEVSDDLDNEVNKGTSYIREEREYPNEHLRLLPWLYKCGFHINQQERDTIELPSLFRHSVTYNLSLNNPSSLKDSARLAIRATYPGRRLHKLINSLTLPITIREYILMESLNIDP